MADPNRSEPVFNAIAWGGLIAGAICLLTALISFAAISVNLSLAGDNDFDPLFLLTGLLPAFSEFVGLLLAPFALLMSLAGLARRSSRRLSVAGCLVTIIALAIHGMIWFPML